MQWRDFSINMSDVMKIKNSGDGTSSKVDDKSKTSNSSSRQIEQDTVPIVNSKV